MTHIKVEFRGFHDFLISAKQFRIAEIVKVEKSFPVIPSSNQFPRNPLSLIHFCVGVWVCRHLWANFSYE